MRNPSLRSSQNYKAHPYQYASSSKQILKSKAKPFPSCTHYSFNDHHSDDCRNYPECEICRSYDHFTLGHNRVIQVRGGVLAESSQSSESSIGRNMREPIWYLDNGCSRSMTSVKSYLHKYVEQPGPKVVFGDNSSCITEGYGSINYGAERKNRTLIEAARTMLKGLVLSKHFWTETVRITCYTQDRSIIVKRHDKTPYEIFRERIPDINYFHVFGCFVFIHNHKDHLGEFDVKADDGYFLGYLFNYKAFRVFNTRRQQIEETYHVTFNECIEAIRFTNTLVDEIRIDHLSRYPLDEFLQEDDPSRQYQANSDISYYNIPHGRSLTKLTQDTHVTEVITLNVQDTPHTKDVKGSPDLTNTKGTQVQEVQTKLINHQPTKESSGNNTETSVPITEPLVPKVP
ncbi:retrovirus-related pol polyprotein from transposon TNT 1-94 [Tanacetum coccineum]